MNYICLPDLLLSFNPVIAKSGNKENLSQMVPYKPFHSSLGPLRHPIRSETNCDTPPPPFFLRFVCYIKSTVCLVGR